MKCHVTFGVFIVAGLEGVYGGAGAVHRDARDSIAAIQAGNCGERGSRYPHGSSADPSRCASITNPAGNCTGIAVELDIHGSCNPRLHCDARFGFSNKTIS